MEKQTCHDFFSRETAVLRQSNHFGKKSQIDFDTITSRRSSEMQGPDEIIKEELKKASAR
jgi:hypothetical protein